MGEIEKFIDDWEEEWCSQSEGMNPKMKEELINLIKEYLNEKIDLLDIEFAIATDIIEKESGKKIDLPEELVELMDRYWRYVFVRLNEELLGLAEEKS